MIEFAFLLAYPLIIGIALLACVLVFIAVLPAPIVPSDDEPEIYGDASTFGREVE
jgi:hypothetical protein